MYRALATSLLIAVSALAQAPTQTIPSGHLSLEGNSRHHVGWRYRGARGLYLYSPQAAGTTSAGYVLTELWVRGDGPTNAAYSQSLDVQLSLSSLGVTAWGQPSLTSFDVHHGTDRRIFAPRQSVSFPGWSSASPGPRPFSLRLKGSAPFVVRPGSALCVDLQFFASSTQSVVSYADAVLSSRYGSSFPAGTAATPSNFNHYATGHYVGAQDFYLYGYCRTPGELAVQWFGSAPAAQIVPGVGTLHTLPVAFYPGAVLSTGSNGRVQFSYGTPPPGTQGAVLYSQIASFGAQGQLRLSHGLKVQLGVGSAGRPDCSCVYGYASGTRSFDPVLSKPMYSANVGLVLGR